MNYWLKLKQLFRGFLKTSSEKTQFLQIYWVELTSIEETLGLGGKYKLRVS